MDRGMLISRKLTDTVIPKLCFHIFALHTPPQSTEPLESIPS